MTQILTPCEVTEELVAEVVRIGELRLPIEACGVILPFKFRGRQVIELPNRSKTPETAFEFRASDLSISLEKWVDTYPSYASLEKITIWHTHPSGHVGPGQFDLEHRVTGCGNLVVSMGEKPCATWY